MRISLTYLFAASVAVSGLMTACSGAGGDSGALLPQSGAPTAAPAAGNGTTSAQPTPTSPSTGTSPTPGSTTTTTSTPATPPPPASGPGSASSPAHQFFVASVFPAISVCVGCHAAGTDGAPKMLDTDPAKAYSGLDSAGMISNNSQLLVQGAHDQSKAPALTSAQQSVITQWLGMEASERGGKATPSVYEKLASCMSATDFAAIQFNTLVTTPRTGENTNRCTGCNKAKCTSCHTDTVPAGATTGAPFVEQMGDPFTTPAQFFANSQRQPYITMYFGTNGTDAVASNRIQAKATAVAAGAPYSHPMFTLTPTVQTQIDTFVNNTLAAYKAGTCTGSVPDAGP